MNGESLIQMRSGSDGRRIRLLRVSLDVLAEFFRLDGSTIVKMVGFPADGQIVAASMGVAYNEVLLTVQSETFSPMEPGLHIAPLEIHAERVTDIRKGLIDIAAVASEHDLKTIRDMANALLAMLT